MNAAVGRSYRLVARDGTGLSCDEDGVSLGATWLVRGSAGDDLAQRYAVRPIAVLGDLLSVAYGRQAPGVVQRCHRGLRRVATRLELGDLPLAAIEAVMIGFPDLSPAAMAKLARVADLEKAGTAWQDQPRVAAGQHGGGQWTSDGGDGSPAAGRSGSDGSSPAARMPSGGGRPLIDDGVHRPGQDGPLLTSTGGENADDGFRQGFGGNEPPDDFMALQDVFPGLKDNPAVAVPLAPIDSFLGVSSLANEANLEATTAEYFKLADQIRAIDPSFHDLEFQPLAEMSRQGRANVINGLLFQRAVAYYQVRGDIRPLQVETLRYLQSAVDRAYGQAVREYDTGALKVPASRQLAIGNRVDELVRKDLSELFTTNRVHYGRGQNITINNRDVRSEDQTYRRPDLRLGKASFDWSLVFKTFSNAQVRGFFRADSEPDYVVIIRPSQVARPSLYLIARPPGEIRRVEL